MISIGLEAPAAGQIIDGQQGGQVTLVLGGSYRSDEDPNVGLWVILNGRPLPARADPAALRWSATVTLACPSRVRVQSMIEAVVERQRGRHREWVNVRRRSAPRYLVVRDPSYDLNYVVQCELQDSVGRPLMGLAVEMRDSDPGGGNERLGTPGRSDVDGVVTFSFASHDFTDGPLEQGPDLYLQIRDGTQECPYYFRYRQGTRTVTRTRLSNAPSGLLVLPVIVSGKRGFRVEGVIRQRWDALGGASGFLGQPTGDERVIGAGLAREQEFAGGSLYWTPAYGAVALYGMIRAHWRSLGGEASWLGLPVTDELVEPGVPGGRASVFEHGVIRWRPGQPATEGPHDHARIYGQLRAQILARFFALGAGPGRRNIFSMLNELEAEVPPYDGSEASKTENDRARWRISVYGGENPFLEGARLIAALAVEHGAGNAESGRVLEAWLQTVEMLPGWPASGSGAISGFPVRWDAGVPMGPVARPLSELDSFFPRDARAYRGGWTPFDIHAMPKRSIEVLTTLLGPRAAGVYENSSHHIAGAYRQWELSMDELVGLTMSYWVIARHAGTHPMMGLVRRQASRVGRHLADNAFTLVRPMGGFSWRGATGLLPAMEHPIGRALGFAAGGPPFTSSAGGLRTALSKAGYWPMLEGPITGWQLVTWGAAPMVATVASAVGLAFEGVVSLASGVSVEPSAMGAAAAMFLHRDTFDMQANAEAALLPFFMGTHNKAGLFRTVVPHIAQWAAKTHWAVYFPCWLGLTGLGDPDTTTADTFKDWFRIRQTRSLVDEPENMGSRSLFAAGVMALIDATPVSEARLVNKLDEAVVKLCRDRYFDPRLPIARHNDDPQEGIPGQPAEYAQFPWSVADRPSTPPSPLEYLVGYALGAWHASIKLASGQPVTTARFPAALDRATMDKWPRVAVPEDIYQNVLAPRGVPASALQTSAVLAAGPEGYRLFDATVVARRSAPVPPAYPAANTLLCEVTVRVPGNIGGEVDTGITIHPGHAFEISASGSMWCGDVLKPVNGPEGFTQRLVHDARWLLHSGIDPAACEYALLGRLNGWFTIGNSLPRKTWYYPAPFPLRLAINDRGWNTGHGEFLVVIKVYGPAGFPQADVYRTPEMLRDGAVLRTANPRDLIEVSLTAGGTAPDMVTFELTCEPWVGARKELWIREGNVAPAASHHWVVYTEGNRRYDENSLYGYQLIGGDLLLHRQDFLARPQVLQIVGLDRVPLGTRVRLHWVRDV